MIEQRHRHSVPPAGDGWGNPCLEASDKNKDDSEHLAEGGTLRPAE
jgi:hypothetical protein